jgi:conjugative relaxase-like TrwC/TraI family protein
MAVVVTAVSGYDLGYVWKNQAEQAMAERSAGGYYINAAQAGEPPGRWWGPGAAALGLAGGEIVERASYDMVYQQADPRTGEKLGRACGRYVSFADHLAALVAAEPHATAERRLELERLAAQATRRSPAYTDMTVSFSKSISVFHASIRENERRARLAGDTATAQWWADAEARFQEVLQAANRAGLEYVQAHAGITRTGYHGRRVDGREPGRFEEAAVVVSSWLQGTSRDGDPQDHVHNQFARMVQTVRDGRWRALDTMCLRGVLGAVQAVVATHVECGLTAEFGVEWVPRADRKGNEIAGISQEQMDAYSSRTQAITARMPEAVASWTARYGRVPNRRELLHIRQAVTMSTREGKDQGTVDWDALAARWDARLGGQLASIAPRVSRLRAPASARQGAQTYADASRAAQHAQTRAGAVAQSRAAPGRAELTRATQQALALVQSAQSTWTRADLIRQLGLVLPRSTRDMAPDAAVGLLGRLADEALSGRVGQVVCLEAPQWPPLPASLIRTSDGCSIYTRPGTARYATRVQLSLEEQLLADAARQCAPRLSRATAAALLSTSTAALETALRDGVHASNTAPAGCGLRADQAAALYHVLTSAQTAVVLTGPAGSGKTRVLAEAARLWACAGLGPVLGITTAQAARNVLAEAGVGVAENSSVFLGHLPGERGALGIRGLRAGTLLLIDEASMMSIPDLADIIRHAARHGVKVIVAGDQEQLAAVESGGGMRLLAAKLGFAQLTEAVRFTCPWEREASLRLRAGDPAALDIFAEHGRIYSAAPEEAMDLAVRRYVAQYLAGRDVLLMALDHERCRELSRRIRDDLIHLGLVDGTGREIGLAAGARASAGDLIIARANDHDLEAGEPGRTLANGDTLRIEKVRADGTIMVRRALDCDWRTGKRTWSRRFAWSQYHDADLAYAVTGHSAQGRTVAAGIGLFTGTEDRHWMYVALTRAIEENIAITFTETDRTADRRPAPARLPRSPATTTSRPNAPPSCHVRAPLPPQPSRRRGSPC